MDRIYTFKSNIGKEVIVRCSDGSYLTGEEIKHLEAAGSELTSVKYGTQIVKAAK